MYQVTVSQTISNGRVTKSLEDVSMGEIIHGFTERSDLHGFKHVHLPIGNHH